MSTHVVIKVYADALVIPMELCSSTLLEALGHSGLYHVGHDGTYTRATEYNKKTPRTPTIEFATDNQLLTTKD